MNIRNKKSGDKIMQCEHDQITVVNDDSCASIAYEKPILIAYGDVRDITLGPSPGIGESGAGVFFLQP